MLRNNEFLKKGEIILAAAVLLFSAIIYFIPKGGGTVKVYSDGKLYATYSLSDNITADINGTNTLVISDGVAYMKRADCPDRLCVGQGKIGKEGGSIICLPNKVIVEIDGSIDGISR